MAELKLSLLGTVDITINGEQIGVASNYGRALLIYLAVEKHGPHRREVLAEMLWPERPNQVARNNLKQALSNLRMALGDRELSSPYLLVSRNEIQFNQSSHFWIDTVAFGEIIQTCEEHSHADWVTCKACENQWLHAVGMYQGDFLADFYLPDNRDFNDWILLKREVLQRQMAGTLCRLAQIYEAREEFSVAGDYCYQLADLEPWNEENHRSLMRLLALSGRRSAALRQYQACCESLENELGVEPAESTVELYEEIRAWQPETFPDNSLPKIPAGSSKQPILPSEALSGRRLPSRNRLQRSFLGLIFAGLMLGFGLFYWLVGSPQAFNRIASERNDPPQNFLVAKSGTSTPSPFPTATDGLGAALMAVDVPTETGAPKSSSAPVFVSSISIPSENELQALNILYESMDGPNWANSGNWRSDHSACEWHGITCRGEKIIKLELQDNLLNGTLPAEIGQLEFLEILDLRDNQIHGNLPAELGDLSNLKHLFLSGNRELDGPIPPELGNLSNLEELELARWESGGSLLSGEIPPELGHLKKLRFLNISVSLLRGPLPVELCELINLEALFLDANQLSGSIPAEIGQLASLQILDLGGNDFKGPIPPELGNLPELNYLALGGSLLSGEIPPELGNLVRLRYLVLDNTNLSGPLPSTLMNLNLRELTFFGTEICEPTDETIQSWLNNIPDLQSSQIVCAP